jgi:hypothetical protein
VHIRQVLARVLASGEEQGDGLLLRGGYNPAGEHSGTLRRIALVRVGVRIRAQCQHGHGGVVVVQHFALRRLANRFATVVPDPSITIGYGSRARRKSGLIAPKSTSKHLPSVR